MALEVSTAAERTRTGRRLAWLGQPWPLAVIVTLIGAAISAIAVQPLIGIDDANITQVYAENLVAGHGFVYTPGWEKVEGFTSLLWTLVNAALFLVNPEPEALITIVCFGLTVLSIACSVWIAETLASVLGLTRTASPVFVRVATAAAFLLFPGYFAWHVWTLMDVSLWTPLLAILVFASLCIVASFGGRVTVSRLHIAGLIIAAALLPLTRPEGAAIGAATGLAIGVYAFFRGSRAIGFAGLTAAVLAVIVTVAVTMWRLQEFGFPAPNTFYAKMSPDLSGQLKRGFVYVMEFFANGPTAVALALFVGLAVVVFGRRGSLSKEALAGRDAVAVIVLYVLGLTATYIVLGGDYFTEYRFMLPLVVVLAAAAAVAVAAVLAAVPAEFTRRATAGAIAGFIAIAIGFNAVFKTEAGGLEHEFMLPKEGRAAGVTLSSLPSDPGVAIIAAGGFARTYKGRVYDVLGLNWVEMAHSKAPRTVTIRSHDSFDADVFMRHKPGIVLVTVYHDGCKDTVLWPDPFARAVFNGMLEGQEFRKHYVPACYKGITLYARRDLISAHPGLFELPPGAVW